MRALPIILFVSLTLTSACGAGTAETDPSTDPSTPPTATDGAEQVRPDEGDGSARIPSGERQASTPADLHRQVLTSLSDNVIIPTLQAFAQATEDLQQAAAVHTETMTAASLADVQQAWRDTMAIWQQAEVMQIGPTASMSAAPEGQDMRDEIYSWPTVNTCRVDQEITEDAHIDQSAFAAELTNVRGLDAMEYLLFGTELENSCSPNSGINKKGTWDTMVTDGAIPPRRATYLLTVSTLLNVSANAIVNAWLPGQGGFGTSFATAGDGSEVYSSAQEALNRVSDALFYVEKQTKDMKLALPAGIAGGCDANTCPELLESQHAHASKENILSNLEAAQFLLEGTREAGGNGLGLIAVLDDAGASELASNMLTSVKEAHTFIASIEGTFAEALVTNPELVTQAHDMVKAFADLLKTEFVTTLDLDIPKRAAGDND